jgi:hypothetical protein
MGYCVLGGKAYNDWHSDIPYSNNFEQQGSDLIILG